MKKTEVEALCEPEAMDRLEELASEVFEPDVIVELGVYQGASLAHLARGAHEGVKVIGIDPWGMSGAYPNRPHMIKRYPSKGQQVAMAHLRDEGVLDKVTLIRGFSVETAKGWDSKTRVSLLFIDAIHRYREVLEDFYSWLPHLSEGAVVAFDDHDENFDGVRRAVKKIVDAGDLEWVELVGTRLAVLRRPGL